jgi:hypothetical protein
MDAISDMTQRMPVKTVYNKLINNLDMADAPRDTNVVRQKRKHDAAKQRGDEGMSACANFADEWLGVFRQLQTNDIVRFIGAVPNRVPSVILYSDTQLRDIKSFCFNRQSGSVLSFDKTFNLGHIYVTPSVYKNVALQHRRTAESPIFLGPIFVHGHSDVETYGTFFGHLATRFIDCAQTELTLGSDDELAMRKCMSVFFPSASTVVCARHLRENVSRKLDSVIGAKTSMRAELFSSVCDRSHGLMSCSDLISFDGMAKNIRANELARGPPEFRDYCEKRLFPLLRANAAIARQEWTNNNCESINHVLKQYTQWRHQQLPDLLNKLRKPVVSQHLEADRALVGRGDFQLQPSHAKHRLTVEAWTSMSEAQRRKASDLCFRLPSVPSSTSTDGQLTVPLTPGSGRKLHQRKRARNAKTTTVTKPPAKRIRFANPPSDSDK